MTKTDSTPAVPPPSRRSRSIDGLAFSNALPAAIAAALAAASSRALGLAPDPQAIVIAASGTFVVYGLDRVRDVSRDRETSPLRTRFTEANASRLRFAIAGAGFVLLVALITAPPRVFALCALVGAVGVLHRRLKGHALAKSLYVSASWVAVCAGVPLMNATPPGGFDAGLAWLAGILFPTLLANLVASNLRDDETQLAQNRVELALPTTRLLAFVGIAASLAAPAPLTPLVWIPLAEALALAFFRPSEHYGHIGVDGALLVGATLSLIHQAFG